MSLQSDKKTLLTQMGRYMTLLSNLDIPPAEYIEDVDYLRGLTQSANSDEIESVKETWVMIKPKDAYSATFIDTGKVDQKTVIDAITNLDFNNLLQTATNIRIIKKGNNSQ